jgi:hypothetical protein
MPLSRLLLPLASLLLVPAVQAAPRGGRVLGVAAPQTTQERGGPAEPLPPLAEEEGAPDAAPVPPAPEPTARPESAAAPRAAMAPVQAAPAARLPPPRVRSSVGVALGALFPFQVGPTLPRLALQVSGPLELGLVEGRGPARVEWLATAAFSYTARELVGFTGTSEESTLASELMPGARVLYPVHARLNLSAELSVGLSLVRASATTQIGGGRSHTSALDLGAVTRVALGGQVPLDDRLRLFFEPVAVQTYLFSEAGTAWSMQFGLAYAF